MVHRRRERAQQLHAASRVERRAEGDLLIKRGADVVGAREAEQQGARGGATQGEEQNVLVGARGARHVALVTRQRRGIDHDEVEGIAGLAHEAKRVATHEVGGHVRSVRRQVFARQGERAGGGLDQRHAARAAPGSGRREAARVGEQIQHASAGGQRLDQLPRVPLVEVKARLLPLDHVHPVAPGALADLHGRVGKLAPQHALAGRHPFAASGRRVRALEPRLGARLPAQRRTQQFTTTTPA